MEDPDFNHLSLLEIAEMSGFSSLSAFYRVFKEKEGVTPGKYREEKQKIKKWEVGSGQLSNGY